MMITHKPIVWSSTFGSIVLTGLFAQWLGFFEYVWINDPTRISFVILGIFVLASLATGYQSYTKTDPWIMDKLWFTQSALVSMGLIGTVVGFLLMLGNTFSELDLSNPNNAQTAIKSIGLGMSTSLLTTLFGMSTSLLLQIQLMIIKEEDV